jgi:hypothetical protein
VDLGGIPQHFLQDRILQPVWPWRLPEIHMQPDIRCALGSSVNVAISGGDALARTSLAWLIHEQSGDAEARSSLSARARTRSTTDRSRHLI